MNSEETQTFLASKAAELGIDIPGSPSTMGFPPPGPGPRSPSDQLLDPRDGSPLHKKLIPRPDGTAIEIDYNPNTGGVFLDHGELKALSEIPEVRTTLEAVLMSR